MLSKLTSALKLMTLDRFLLLCFGLAVISTLFSLSVSYLAWTPVLLISILGSVMLAGYFLLLYANVKRQAFELRLENAALDPPNWALSLYPDVDRVLLKRSYVAWNTRDGAACGAKVFAVIDVPYTVNELSREDLERRIRAYASLISSEDIMIATYHMRLPIDKTSYLEALRRERDRYKSSYDVGGPESHRDRSEKLSSLLKRIEEKLQEEPYDARFFIILFAKADRLEDVEKKLTSLTPSIKTRFENDIGVVLKELTHNEMLDALRLFPPFPSLEDSNFTKVRVLAMDCAWQNPLVAKRYPPIESLARGAFIGFTFDRVPVSWNPLILGNPHAVVLGPTRSGKTTLLKTLAIRALETYGVPVWIFDPSAEYVDYIKSRGGIVVDFRDPKTQVNPLALCGADPETRIAKFLDMVSHLAGITGPERGILREELVDAYRSAGIDFGDPRTWTDDASAKVTLRRVFELLSRKYAEGRVSPEDRPLVRSLVKDKLPPLVSEGYGFTSEGTLTVSELLESGKPVCFLLKGVPDSYGTAIVWSILDMLSDYMSSRGLVSELRLIVMIDEAHRYCKARVVEAREILPPPVRFVKEAGKYGFAEFCATQDVDDLPSALFNNAGTLVVFGSSDEATLEFYQERLGLSESDIERLRWFSRGQAFIKFYSDPRPIPVQIVPEEG